MVVIILYSIPCFLELGNCIFYEDQFNGWSISSVNEDNQVICDRNLSISLARVLNLVKQCPPSELDLGISLARVLSLVKQCPVFSNMENACPPLLLPRPLCSDPVCSICAGHSSAAVRLALDIFAHVHV